MDLMTLVAKLTLDSSEYEQGLGNAEQKANGFGGTIAKGLGGVAKVGAAALTAATGATIAFGKSAVDAGKSFDSSMSQVAATMGLTMEEMETQVGATETSFGSFEGTLRDFAQYMGANTAFSATEAADALNYMALAGYDAQTSMNMLPNVLSLAAAGSFDLARASDMITDTQTAFGISLDRTSLMVDEMAKAASTGNTSVEQLGDAFLVVGGLAQELNGGVVNLADGTQATADGVQELEIALTAMANAGVKGSEAGTHMRNMLLKLSSPTDDGASALRSLGVEIFDTEGNMRSLKDIFQDMSNTMNGDVGPALEEFYAKFEGMSEKGILDEFEKSPEDFEFLGTTIIDSTGKLRDFNEVFNELKDGISQESKIQLISDMFNTRDIAAAEALLNAVEQDWDKIGESILHASDDGGAAAKMAKTQLDNLAGDLTLFDSALEGAKIAISDQLTPTLRDFVKLGTRGLSDVTLAFKEGGLSGAMESVGTWISDALNMIIKKLPQAVEAGAQLLTAVVNGIAENVPQIATAGIEIVTSLANSIIQNLPTLISSALEAVLAFAVGLGEALPELIPAAVDMIIAIAENLIDNVDKIIEAAIAIMIGLAEGIINALPRLIEKIPTILSSIVDALLKGIPEFGRAGGELLGSIVRNLPEIIVKIVKAIPPIIAAIAKAIVGGIPSIMQAGMNLIGGLGKGIVDGAVGVINKAKQVASDVLGAIKGFFGIHSPSTVMDKEVGQMIGEGEIQGMRRKIPEIRSTAEEMSDVIIDGASPEISTLPATGSYWQGYSTNSGTGRIEQLLITLIETMQRFGVTIDGKALVGYLAPEIDRYLGDVVNNLQREGVYV